MLLIRKNITFYLLSYVCLTTKAAGIAKWPHWQNGDIFYYFGYGSNMLTKRIQIQNPTAQKIDHALLKDYRLDFNGYTGRWDGAAATIVPTQGDKVHGTLWSIDLINLKDIDDQEGVSIGVYFPINVTVELPDASVLMARAYTMVNEPTTELKSLNWNEIPEDRLPSKTYLRCLVKGAIESNIDPAYVNWLKSIRHNGRVVKRFEDELELQNVELDT